MPKLTEWVITKEGCLFGYVHDDSRHDPETTEFEDGHRVITSPVKTMAKDESYAITQTGTRYELGPKGNKSPERRVPLQVKILVVDSEKEDGS